MGMGLDGLLVVSDLGEVAKEFGIIEYLSDDDMGDLCLFDHTFYHKIFLSWI
jgi:hypothetical protein